MSASASAGIRIGVLAAALAVGGGQAAMAQYFGTAPTYYGYYPTYYYPNYQGYYPYGYLAAGSQFVYSGNYTTGNPYIYGYSYSSPVGAYGGGTNPVAARFFW